MKNRKFIGKDGLEAIGWDIETYTSKIFENKPCFWSEFCYTNGHSTVTFNLETSKVIASELTKFINEASIKEHEFKEKQKLPKLFKKKGKK